MERGSPEYAAHVAAVVARAPEVTPERLERLRRLLGPVVTELTAESGGRMSPEAVR